MPAFYFLFLFSSYGFASAPVRLATPSAWEAVAQASPVVQITLLILILLSVVCWTVAISKFKQFKELHQANSKFVDHFWKTSSLDLLFQEVDQHKSSSIARIFRQAYLEMKKLAENARSQKSEGEKSRTLLSGSDNVERSLRRATEVEISAMESKLTLLATTGSTGPFIGLFGTVWGIMGSFHKIGLTGNASLAVVAPGISEALVATAIGLAAAIPAVVLYNHFLGAIKREEMEISNFCSDFMNVIKRNFFKE